MPNTKSVIKRVRTNELRRQRNVSAKSRILTMTKKTVKAFEDGSENATELRRETIALVDRAASNGILHANAASRKKSQLMRLAQSSSTS
jgi:small subunit ribosomal protein S20